MTRLLARLVDIRRHHLGPRVYVGGVRVHECFAGLFTIMLLAAMEVTGHVGHPHFDALVGAVAVWMIAKDWPDFFPSRRDTYAWNLGLHQPGEQAPRDVTEPAA